MHDDVLNIIIPFTNERSVFGCVKSLNNQKCDIRSFKIWFVNNDVENNETQLYIQNNINKNIDFSFTHCKLRGVSQARNKALKLIKRGWVLFVDVDDEISNNFIAKWVKTQKFKNYIYKPWYMYINDTEASIQMKYLDIKNTFNVGFIFYWDRDKMKLFDLYLDFNETLDFMISNNMDEMNMVILEVMYTYYLNINKKYKSTREYLKNKHKNNKIINLL